MGMYGKRYVWIMHYGNDPYWMTKPTADGACSAEQISTAAASHFVTRDITLREDDTVPLANMVRKYSTGFSANMRRWHNVGLSLGQRRRQWANSKPTFGQRLMLTGFLQRRSESEIAPFSELEIRIRYNIKKRTLGK